MIATYVSGAVQEPRGLRILGKSSDEMGYVEKKIDVF